MENSLVSNILTIAAFALLAYWRLSDPRSKKEQWEYYLKPKSILIGLFTFFYFLLNYLSAIYFPLPDQFLSVFGVLLFIAGVALSIWAKFTMGKIWGVPAQMRKDQDKLVKHGPFKYTRNPIYLGLLMVLIGYGSALQSYFIFLALIPIFYFWNFAKKEEELLEKNFKDEYLKYKKSVPRFF